jgi:hypothetical protein
MYCQFVNTTNRGCPWVQQLSQNIWQLQTFYVTKQLCSETEQNEHNVQHNLFLWHLIHLAIGKDTVIEH